MIYMAADNDLEEFAINDINELESVSGLDNGAVNVIVLIDRITGYSSADGDWTGTRLYKIKYDPVTSDKNIRSLRLSGMGLSSTGDIDELNMADPANLKNFVKFIKDNYPADDNMLVIWNHGSGWRNIVYTSDPVKSICQDITSGGDILYNSEVRTALTGQSLSILGFDACLMGMIESIYEFKGLADFMIASPEEILTYGWDYDSWLTAFLGTDLTVEDLYETAVDSFSAFYISVPKSCLSVYDLSKAEVLYNAFGNFTLDLNSYLWNSGHINRSEDITDNIMSNVERYYVPAAGGYFHPDVNDLADKFSFLPNSSLLKSAVSSIVAYHWTQGSGNIFSGNPISRGIAVYYGTYDASAVLTLRNDYAVDNVTLFTEDSIWPDFLKDLYCFPPESEGKWLSTELYSDAAISVDDHEYYLVYIFSEGTSSFTLSNYGSNDLDIFLYSFPSKTIIDYSMTAGSFETINYFFSSAGTGWYILEVFHYSGLETGYDIQAAGANIK